MTNLIKICCGYLSFVTFVRKSYRLQLITVGKEGNVPIRYVHASDDANHDLGYGLRKEFWHKGLILEACQTVVELLKQTTR